MAATVAKAPETPAKRLSYITASASSLRLRANGLIQRARATKQTSWQVQAEIQMELDAALAELKGLQDQLKPLAAISGEFRSKWDKQKRELISRRESEIMAHLEAESKAAIEKAEHGAAEELQEIQRTTERSSREAAEKMSNKHRHRLEDTVELWRERTHGAGHVKMPDVDRALRGALQRVADWAADEERHVMDGWTAELSRVVSTAHELDEESLAASQDAHMARQACLEGALSRTWKVLAQSRKEMAVGLAKRQQELQDHPAQNMFKRTPAQTAAVVASVGKATRAQLDAARSEAQAAMESNRAAVEAKLDQACKRELRRTAAFEVARDQAGAALSANLAQELGRMRQAGLPATARTNRSDSDRSPSPSPRPPKEASPRVQPPPALKARQSVVPGAQATRLVNSPRERAQTSQGGMRAVSSNPGQTPQSQIESEEAAPPVAVATVDQMQAKHIATLRDQLQRAKLALQSGDLSDDWARDLSMVEDYGRNNIRSAEAALEGQAGVLRSRSTTEEDMTKFSRAFMEIAAQAKQYSQGVREEMSKMRNVKAGLATARAQHVRRLLTWVDHDESGLEREALPIVSRLARETEVCIEIGRALEQGSDRFPLVVVGGVWRRAVAAALQLLARVWQGSKPDLLEQRKFMEQLLAIIARTPEGVNGLSDRAVTGSLKAFQGNGSF